MSDTILENIGAIKQDIKLIRKNSLKSRKLQEESLELRKQRKKQSELKKFTEKLVKNN